MKDSELDDIMLVIISILTLGTLGWAILYVLFGYVN